MSNIRFSYQRVNKLHRVRERRMATVPNKKSLGKTDQHMCIKH